MSDVLKLCPFCGGFARIGHNKSRNINDEYYLVMCSRCFGRTIGETVEEAETAWNKRVRRIEIMNSREKIPECDYCKSIKKATSASPRKNYTYCPMCGRKRI